MREKAFWIQRKRSKQRDEASKLPSNEPDATVILSRDPNSRQSHNGDTAKLRFCLKNPAGYERWAASEVAEGVRSQSTTRSFTELACQTD